MTPQFIEAVAMEAIQTVLMVSALIVGLLVSIFQATTQINEMTLAYIPKIVAIYLALLLFSGFMLDRLVSFTTHIFSDFSRFTL